MTTLWLALLLGAVELAVHTWLRRRIAYTRYPAFMTALLVESAAHIGGAYDFRIDTWYSQPLRMAIRLWVVLEVYHFACLRFSRREKLRLCGEAIGISGTCAWLTTLCTHLSPWDSWHIFRGYWHLALAAALWWLVIWVRQQGVAENQEHAAYRRGIVCWFSLVALAGMFVRGSAGFWIFPFENWVWWWVRVVGLSLLIPVMAWIGWSMGGTFSSLRPEVAYGSIEAAWGMAPMMPASAAEIRTNWFDRLITWMWQWDRRFVGRYHAPGTMYVPPPRDPRQPWETDRDVRRIKAVSRVPRAPRAR